MGSEKVRKCVIMIQPVSALSPKVFRGSVSNQKSPLSKDVEKRIAIINSVGMSAAMGALATLAARSYTATWKGAGACGIGATMLSMMFVLPRFLYKAGINTTSEKKLLALKKNISKVK